MKYSIFFLVIFISTKCIAQIDTICGRIPVQNSKVIYQEVISVDSASKDILYKNALSWISQKYVSPDKVISYKDDSNKERIIINGVGTSIPYKYAGVTMNYTYKYRLQIDFKDGKYKYELTEIYYRSDESAYYSINSFISKSETKYMKQCFLSIDGSIVPLLNSLKAELSGPKKSEW